MLEPFPVSHQVLEEPMPPSKVPAAETIALSRENGFERIECE